MYCSTQNRPLIIFGLLPHEQKMSLVNVVLKRAGESLIPIKSKERLIFQCGFRRFSNCPIFSQHTNGNKHKVCLNKISLLFFLFSLLKTPS